jgi:hypothetical protein
MVSTATARIAGALGTVGAFAAAMIRGGLTAWAAGTLALGGLLLLAAVLFVRSDVPARRLRGLIQAWHTPEPTPTSHCHDRHGSSTNA